MENWQKIPKYDNCFICGPKNKSGLDLTFEVLGDEIRTEWTPRPDHSSYDGIAHGGVISAVLDEALGWTGWSTFKSLYLTAELTVRFVRPVLTGRRYIVKARLTRARSRFYIAEGEVVSEAGEISASAVGKYMVTEDVESVFRKHR